MKKWIKISFVSILCLTFMFLLAGFVYVGAVLNEYNIDLNLDKLENYTNKITIFDNKNDVISKNNIVGSKLVDLEQISPKTKNAFLSIEDKNFYNHHGLNYERILKAFFNNLKSGYSKEGASTITQQLVKNTMLTSEKTFDRKIKEAILALNLEKRYSKDEILNTYLNVVYFGHNCYGIEEASKKYFGTTASKLSLAQSATLAGIIKSPSFYSPIENPENCLKRRNIVLNQMFKNGVITETELNEALNTKLDIIEDTGGKLSVFDSLVISEATKKLKLSEKELFSSGLKIYTTFDEDIQTTLTKSLNLNLKQNQNATGIVIDPKTGGILGYCSTLTSPEIKRSPASLIKPILCYASAFEQNILSPQSQILDEKISFDDFSPQNVENKYYGWTSVREALSHSLNIPAIKTLEYVGIDKAKNFASKFGVEFTNNDNHLAIALGSIENGVTPIEITNAYSTFANLGVVNKPHFITKILNKNNTVLYEFKEDQQHVCKDSTAYLISDILIDSSKTGTAKTLSNLNLKIASKTGTNGQKNGKNLDAWNISYNPNYCVGFWYGNISSNHNYDLEKSQNGGTIATKSAYAFWKEIKNVKKLDDFMIPKSIVKLNLDKTTLDNQHVLKIADNNSAEIDTTSDYFSNEFASKLSLENSKSLHTNKNSAELISKIWLNKH